MDDVSEAEFHQFPGELIASGQKLSPEDALELWGTGQESETEEEWLQSLRDGIARFEAGQPGIPMDDLIQRPREKLEGMRNEVSRHA
jgi:hypothetical protein